MYIQQKYLKEMAEARDCILQNKNQIWILCYDLDDNFFIEIEDINRETYEGFAQKCDNLGTRWVNYMLKTLDGEN